MEAAGLTVGAVALVDPLIKLVNRFRVYGSFQTDSDALDAEFDALTALYESWKAETYDSDTHSSDSTIDSKKGQVLDRLRGIIDTLTKQDEGATPPQKGKPGFRRHKLDWAFGGKERRDQQVAQLQGLIDVLLKLISARRPASAPEEATLEPRLHHARTEISNISDQLTQIRDLVNYLAQTSERKQDMFSWLRGQYSYDGRNEDRYERLSSNRVLGTCDWILERQAFKRWSDPVRSPDTPQTLWIHGPPGFGKSVLCSRIIEHLAESSHGPVVYFFFADDENRSDPYSVMRFWLSQLAIQPEVYKYVRDEWEESTDNIIPPRTVTELLRKALQIMQVCYLVVDGLDECNPPDGSIRTLSRFFEDVKKAVTPATRVLLVSREDPDIRNALGAGYPNGLDEYQISSSDVKEDTGAFSQSIVHMMLPGKDDAIVASLSSTMKDRCEGQFLWIEMQRRSLKKSKWVKDPEKLLALVRKTPKDLDMVYEKIWIKIKSSRHWERAVTLLRWITFAVRPLTVGEITAAALIDEEGDSLLTDELPDEIPDEYVDQEILMPCGPLIEIRASQKKSTNVADRTIHLAHFTIREFLVKHLPIAGIFHSENLRVPSQRIQNTLLARLCLRYLQFQKTWHEELGSGSSDDSPFQTAFRDYAASLWHIHVRLAVPDDQDPDMLNRVLAFMDDTHLPWIAWRMWVDEHDPAERFVSRDEDVPPGPAYYAARFRLVKAATRHVNTFGPGRPAGNSRRCVLYICVWARNLETASAVLDAGVDLQAWGTQGLTPLLAAVHSGFVEFIQLLLLRGADIEARDAHGWTSLTAAGRAGRVEVVKLLVERGARVTAADGIGQTPVTAAARAGHVEIIKFLAEHGVDLIAADSSGWTPLTAAAGWGRIEAVKFLLEHGLDPVALEGSGWTPLTVAASEGRVGVVKFLIERGLDPMAANSSGLTPLTAAVLRGCLEVINLLVECGADITAADGNGTSPLTAAIRQGQMEVVKFLVEHGADVTAADGIGWAPLTTAICKSHVEVTKFLIEQGADVLTKDSTGLAPLTAAASNGHVEVVKLLVAHGADMMAADGNGRTPLTLAADEGHLEVVKLLVEKGTDVMAADDTGRTPLTAAAEGGQVNVMEFFADLGSDISAHDEAGITPASSAVMNGNLEVLKLLVDRGADISSGVAILAARVGHVEITEFLEERGVGTGRNTRREV